MPSINKTRLQKRILSALILAPVTVWAVWYGDLPFLIFILLLSAISFYEWFDLSKKTPRIWLFMALGSAYIPLCFWSFYVIREKYTGYAATLFVLMVWASDIGAYFTGKFIGGPKMSTSISPNKTWAGYAGAVFFPAFLGLVYGLSFLPSHQLHVIFIPILAGASVGVVGQAGDLLISWFKRHAKVKDSGHLIPGHGGLLDRIDAMMLAGPVFLLVMKKFSYGFHF